MANEITDILNLIAADFEGNIQPDSNVYHLITMAKVAKLMDKSEYREKLREKYPRFRAIVPLRNVSGGIKAEFKGSELSDYVQLNSGILVPEYIAKEAELPSTPYKPKEKIIVKFYIQ